MIRAADSWLILVVLAISGLVAGTSLNQALARVPTWQRKPESRARIRFSLLALIAWGAAALSAAVLGWTVYPGEVKALALAAMLTMVVGHIVITALFMAPIAISQRRSTNHPAEGATDLYKRWHLRRTFVDVLAFLVTVIALLAWVDSAPIGL